MIPTAEEITRDWGDRCPDFEPGCFSCQMWAMHDEIERLRAAPSAGGETVKAIEASADVLAERRRQVEAEGWSATHDDQYRQNELVRAAMCYLLGNPGSWPWAYVWWKPGDPRRNLIKAAALIIAEIERLDRSALSAPLTEKEKGR